VVVEVRWRLWTPALLLLLAVLVCWWQHGQRIQVDAFTQAYKLAGGLPGQRWVLC
jgi:hypothetical protein